MTRRGALVAALAGAWLPLAGIAGRDASQFPSSAPDLAVGLTGYSNGEPQEGAVMLFRGGPDGLSTRPSWVYESNTPYESVSERVAAAGDVNGDGLADVVAVGRQRMFLFLGRRGGR